jgi:hypothetical protein
MGDTGSDIIVKGASVHVNFDGSIYKNDLTDPNHHKHEQRKITRVRVQDEKGNDLFNRSDEDGDGLKWTVTISTM